MTIYEIHTRANTSSSTDIDDYLLLDYSKREKCRFKTNSKNGVETRVFLERGAGILNVGDILQTACGKNIGISGEVEPLVSASCDDWETFSKACYHLGNRHVRIQVSELSLSIKPDHVLEDMLKMMGLRLSQNDAVFEPESGAYATDKTGHVGHGHHHHS